MKFAIYTISFSPHQLPLAQAIMDEIGEDEFRYVSVRPVNLERKNMGWNSDEDAKWHIRKWEQKYEAQEILENVEVLMCTERDFELMARRDRRGLITLYCSERWFKPKIGILRLLSPSYFRMAKKCVDVLRNCVNVFYMPMGIHAARDMARLCGLCSGDLGCLFYTPRVDFDKKPGGRIWQYRRRHCNANKHCLGKMRMWGYFVTQSTFCDCLVHKAKNDPVTKQCKELRVLWVGRLLEWKHVETIIWAVCMNEKLRQSESTLPKITLDVYGAGPCEGKLRTKTASFSEIIKFHPPVRIEDVRCLMREHDMYVLASDASEGWGAVVNEALEEGMRVIGTYEAGSSATVLPENNLFHAGKGQELLSMLERGVNHCGIGAWSVGSAASYMLKEWIQK